MSSSNYLVVPKHKLLFEMSSSADDDKAERIKQKLDALGKLDEDSDPYGIMEKRHDQLMLKEQAVLVQYADKSFGLAEDIWKCAIIIAMGNYDPDCRIITENDPELDRLRKSGYRIIERP
ncbi:MAG: hypothetical protein V1728_03800 [Candidatus Micrarchaeota archaeon]